MKFKVGDQIHIKGKDNATIFKVVGIVPDGLFPRRFMYTLQRYDKIQNFPSGGIDDTCVLYLEPNDVLKDLVCK